MPRRIARISIDNFQSHSSTVMEMAEGLNVITGESDQGKTAILRALKWLFFNEPRGTDFVRVGQSECRVTVEMDDGVRVSRERGPARNRYVLWAPGGEPQVFEGFGSRVPAEVISALGVEPVVLDDDMSIPLNMGEQLDAPFLLGESGAVKAKAIGRICGVHIIDAAIRNVQRDIVRLQQRERELERGIAGYEEKLAGFADLPVLGRNAAEAERLMAQAQGIGERVALCRRLSQELGDARREIARLEALIRGLEGIHLAERELNSAIDAAAAAASLDEHRMNLAHVRNEVLLAETTIERTRSTQEALELLDEASLMRERGMVLRSLRSELERERTGQSQMRSRIDEFEERIRRLVGEYQTLLMKEGRCPTCFGRVTAEVIKRIAGEYLAGGGIHGDGTGGGPIV